VCSGSQGIGFVSCLAGASIAFATQSLILQTVVLGDKLAITLFFRITEQKDIGNQAQRDLQKSSITQASVISFQSLPT